MPDEPEFIDEMTRRLYTTDDAEAWAAAFMETVTKRPDSYPEGTEIVCVDEGMMISWFANAMDAAKRLEHERVEPGYG